MKEITVTIKAFNKEWEIKVQGFNGMPEDRLKTLAINRFIKGLKETLLEENKVVDRTSLINSIDYVNP